VVSSRDTPARTPQPHGGLGFRIPPVRQLASGRPVVYGNHNI